MASEGSGDASVSVALPESLRRWLDERAAEDDRSPEDVLLQLLSAYRKVEGLEAGEVEPVGAADDAGAADATGEQGDSGGADAAGGADGAGGQGGTGTEPLTFEAEVRRRVDERLDEAVQQRVDERLDETLPDRVADALDDREVGSVDGAAVEDFESRFEELLEDVRERVVQIKREADAKAPRDHDHPELATAAELDEELSTLDERLDHLERRLDAGFDNYEDVLEYLVDAVETATERRTRLARALAETREELRRLAARDRARSAVDELRREAGSHGVREARCGDCGSTVDVGLLTRTACPHCAATFVGIEPSSGFFGSNTLRTGDRPALAAADATEAFEHGVAAVADPAAREPPGIGLDEDASDEPDEDASDEPGEDASDRESSGREAVDTREGDDAE